MAIIKELNNGKIRIHDDYMVETKEETEEIIQRVGKIMAIGGERKRKTAR